MPRMTNKTSSSQYTLDMSNAVEMTAMTQTTEEKSQRKTQDDWSFGYMCLEQADYADLKLRNKYTLGRLVFGDYCAPFESGTSTFYIVLIMNLWVVALMLSIFLPSDKTTTDNQIIIFSLGGFFGVFFSIQHSLSLNLDMLKLLATNFECWYLAFQFCLVAVCIMNMQGWDARVFTVAPLCLCAFNSGFNDAAPAYLRAKGFLIWSGGIMLFGGLFFGGYFNGLLGLNSDAVMNIFGSQIHSGQLMGSTAMTLLLFSIKNAVSNHTRPGVLVVAKTALKLTNADQLLTADEDCTKFPAKDPGPCNLTRELMETYKGSAMLASPGPILDREGFCFACGKTPAQHPRTE